MQEEEEEQSPSPISTHAAIVAGRYYQRLSEPRSHSGSPLLRRALRHNNSEAQKSLPKQAKVEAWLTAVMLYTQREEMKDPDTADEAPEDVWAGPTLPPTKEDDKAWKDGVSER